MTTYGSDFDCTNDLTADLALAPTEGAALAQAIVRRLQGRLWHSPQNGFDIENLVGAAGNTGAIELAVRAEAAKDERVRAADFVVTTRTAEALEGELVIEPADATKRLGVAPFRLTLTVDNLTGEIEAQDPSPVASFGLFGRSGRGNR